MSSPIDASKPSSPAGPGASYNFPPATARTGLPPLDPRQTDSQQQQPLPPSPTAEPAGSSDDVTFIGSGTPPRNDSFTAGDDHLHNEPYQNKLRVRRPSEATSTGRSKSPNHALECKEEDDFELMKAERIASRTSHVNDPDAMYRDRHVHHHATDPSVPVGDSGEPEGHGHGHRHGPWRPAVHETNKFARFVKKVSGLVEGAWFWDDC